MSSADFTIAEFLAWVRTKPADEAYNYASCSECAVAQFIVASGRAKATMVSFKGWDDDAGVEHPFPEEIERASVKSETFGELVERLEQVSA